MKCQLDAFAEYVSEAEREGPDNYPLYHWTKANSVALGHLRMLGVTIVLGDPGDHAAHEWLKVGFEGVSFVL